MGLFSNPLSYAGYPADETTAQKVNSTVRAATLAEVQAGALNNVYVSPATAQGLDAGLFASPPALGNVAPAAVFSTTLSSTGSTTLATTGATVNTFGNSNASTTNTFTAGAETLTMTNTAITASILAVTGNATLGTTGATVNTLGSSNASSTTTLTAGAAVLGLTNIGGTYPGHLANTAPAAGFIGQEIRSAIAHASAVSLTTATPANITSISLTAGIWNVYAIGIMSGGAITGTIFEVGISQTSATLATLGDSDTQTPTMATATCDSTLTVPGFRISLASTTTIYLVTSATFSGGSATAYGRISATRVA